MPESYQTPKDSMFMPPDQDFKTGGVLSQKLLQFGKVGKEAETELRMADHLE